MLYISYMIYMIYLIWYIFNICHICYIANIYCIWCVDILCTLLSWVWWKRDIFCLQWEWNPHLRHSGPVCYHFTTQAPWCHQYTETQLSMQLLTSEVSANYYTRPSGIVSLFNAYNYIQAMALHIDTQGRFNNHITLSLYSILVTAAVSWVWSKWEILCLERESNPHLSHSRSVCYHYTT